MLRTIWQFNFLDTCSKGSHIIKLKSYTTNEIVKITLGKANFDCFIISRHYLKTIDYFEHEEECWWRTISLFVFLFCKLPVCHNIPNNLPLVQGRLLKLLILEVYYFKKAKHLRANSLWVYSELINNSLLNICKSIIRLYPNKNTIPNWQINRNWNLSFAH